MLLMLLDANNLTVPLSPNIFPWFALKRLVVDVESRLSTAFGNVIFLLFIAVIWPVLSDAGCVIVNAPPKEGVWSDVGYPVFDV